ncbi:hypothetical protein RUM43_006960 [Polyplax serrata]|uniref:Uncharacterized protein n=1 Tax=Polyplax serrata TaxID=468196 RepID=A0AAN8PLP3_POLSC
MSVVEKTIVVRRDADISKTRSNLKRVYRSPASRFSTVLGTVLGNEMNDHPGTITGVTVMTFDDIPKIGLISCRLSKHSRNSTATKPLIVLTNPMNLRIQICNLTGTQRTRESPICHRDLFSRQQTTGLKSQVINP